MKGLRSFGLATSIAVGLLLSLSATPVFSAISAGSPAAISEAAGSWVRLGSGTSLNLNGVFGGAASAFAVGTNGTFLFFDGFVWRTVSTPTTSELHAVWAGVVPIAPGVPAEPVPDERLLPGIPLPSYLQQQES